MRRQTVVLSADRRALSALRRVVHQIAQSTVDAAVPAEPRRTSRPSGRHQPTRAA